MARFELFELLHGNYLLKIAELSNLNWVDGNEPPSGGAAFQQPESGNGQRSVENIGNLLRQVSTTSTGEIDNLISDLQTLRRKLQTDGDRIQRDIMEYAELSQRVMQLTSIISDSVKKLPLAPRTSLFRG